VDNVVHGMFVDAGADSDVHGFGVGDERDYGDVVVCYFGREGVAEAAAEEDTVGAAHGGGYCLETGFEGGGGGDAEHEGEGAIFGAWNAALKTHQSMSQMTEM